MSRFVIKSNKSVMILGLCLLATMSLPAKWVEKTRGAWHSLLLPVHSFIVETKAKGSRVWNFSDPLFSRSNEILNLPEEMRQLQLENTLLTKEVERLKDFSEFERYLFTQLDQLLDVNKKSLAESWLQHFQDSKRLLEVEVSAVPARVIFRDPTFWQSSLWINLGSEHNISTSTVVGVNSPVLFGNSVIGVVDYISKSQSRVRLITDPSVALSVRCVRGKKQKTHFLKKVNAFIEELSSQNNLAPDLQNALLEKLNELRGTLNWDTEGDEYFAKGVIQGASKTRFRAAPQLLKGFGFNYDFPDRKGEAKDLLSGSIINQFDLLETSGLDGIFPEGLLVGEVFFINPLREGGYAYDILAKPAAGSLENIKVVSVLPPPVFQPQ